MKTNIKKRFIAIFVAMTLVFGLMPGLVMAADAPEISRAVEDARTTVEGTSISYNGQFAPDLADGQVWFGKEVVDNGDGTFDIILKAKGNAFAADGEAYDQQIPVGEEEVQVQVGTEDVQVPVGTEEVEVGKAADGWGLKAGITIGDKCGGSENGNTNPNIICQNHYNYQINTTRENGRQCNGDCCGNCQGEDGNGTIHVERKYKAVYETVTIYETQTQPVYETQTQIIYETITVPGGTKSAAPTVDGLTINDWIFDQFELVELDSRAQIDADGKITWNVTNDRLLAGDELTYTVAFILEGAVPNLEYLTGQPATVGFEAVYGNPYYWGKPDVSKAGDITSHSHDKKWLDNWGIYCLFGDSKNDNNNKVIIYDEFDSVDIGFKSGGNYTVVTFLYNDGNGAVTGTKNNVTGITSKKVDGGIEFTWKGNSNDNSATLAAVSRPSDNLEPKNGSDGNGNVKLKNLSLGKVGFVELTSDIRVTKEIIGGELGANEDGPYSFIAIQNGGKVDFKITISNYGLGSEKNISFSDVIYSEYAGNIENWVKFEDVDLTKALAVRVPPANSALGSTVNLAQGFDLGGVTFDENDEPIIQSVIVTYSHTFNYVFTSDNELTTRILQTQNFIDGLIADLGEAYEAYDKTVAAFEIKKDEEVIISLDILQGLAVEINAIIDILDGLRIAFDEIGDTDAIRDSFDESYEIVEELQ